MNTFLQISISTRYTAFLYVSFIHEKVCVNEFLHAKKHIFLWNFQHSKTPGAVWILFNVLGTVSFFVYLGVTLTVTEFIYDLPWQPITVHNDKFNFYLLLVMFRVVCLCDFFLTFYFVLVVMWFLRTVNWKGRNYYLGSCKRCFHQIKEMERSKRCNWTKTDNAILLTEINIQYFYTFHRES